MAGSVIMQHAPREIFSKEVCPKDSEFWIRGGSQGYEIGAKRTKDMILQLGPEVGRYVYAGLRGQERIEKHPHGQETFRGREFVSTRKGVGSEAYTDNMPLTANQQECCVHAVSGFIKNMSYISRNNKIILNPSQNVLAGFIQKHAHFPLLTGITLSGEDFFEFQHEFVILGPIATDLRRIICFEKVTNGMPWRLVSLASIYEMYYPAQDAAGGSKQVAGSAQGSKWSWNISQLSADRARR